MFRKARNQFADRRGSACGQDDGVGTGLHLHMQATFVVQACRPAFAVQGQRHESFRQGRTEHFLARLARGVDAQLGGQLTGNVIAKHAEHEQVDIVGFNCRGRAATEREFIAGTLQRCHRLAVDNQRDQCHRSRHLQGLRALGPGHARAQFVLAHAQPHIRPATIDHRHRLAIDTDLLWPMLLAAGQGHPALDLDMPALADRCALCIGVDAQHTGPGADEVSRCLALVAGQQGTGAELLALEHPAAPGIEIDRNGRRGGMAQPRNRHRQQQDQSTHEQLPPGMQHSCATTTVARRGCRSCAQCVTRRQACSRQARMKPVRKNR